MTTHVVEMRLVHRNTVERHLMGLELRAEGQQQGLPRALTTKGAEKAVTQIYEEDAQVWEVEMRACVSPLSSLIWLF